MSFTINFSANTIDTMIQITCLDGFYDQNPNGGGNGYQGNNGGQAQTGYCPWHDEMTPDCDSGLCSLRKRCKNYVRISQNFDMNLT